MVACASPSFIGLSSFFFVRPSLRDSDVSKHGETAGGLIVCVYSRGRLTPGSGSVGSLLALAFDSDCFSRHNSRIRVKSLGIWE